MGRFRFEDYRQPWETGPHWELKREFMEKYCDMFPEDRLLCLAQAYFNIVMMNCRYPEEVMRQINHLAKPLQMRKKFQECSEDVGAEMPQKQDEKRDKRKSVYESFGMPFKQIKFCKEQSKSDIASDSTNLTQNCSIDSAQIYEQMVAQSQFNHPNVTIGNTNQIVSNSNNQSEGIEYNKICDALGIEFIQNFVQEIRKFQVKSQPSLTCLINAAQSLKIYKMICFQIDQEPNSPCHAPVYQSQCSIKDCVISSEKGSSKKKAKYLSADTAVNTLMTIATQMSSSSKLNCTNKNLIASDPNMSTSCSTNSATSLKTFDSSIKNTSLTNTFGNALNSQLHPIKESFVPDVEISNIMNILKTISEVRVNNNKKKHCIVILNDIAHSLRIQNYISFNTVCSTKLKAMPEYVCKFFLKNILISCEKGITEKDAKIATIKSGFNKIENLANYEIKNGELKDRQNSCTTVSSNHAAHTVNTEVNSDIDQPFIINHMLFNSSMKDGFVLVDNFAIKPISQRNLRCLLSESASFCRKLFEYNFEDVPGSNPPLKKADVILNNIIVGTGISLSKEQAKDIACENAVDMLRKKYYTLKVKNEYIEGFIITRNQVFDGESFSSGALTDSNIGCKMLKSMGWTGGGLGTSGIAEPIEAHGHHSFGQGLGYGKSQGDAKLFKRRIEAMFQDYSRSNSLSDLIFSKDFTKDERKEIHKLAQKYSLHNASRGKGIHRFLTIRRKYNIAEILAYLRNNGGSNSKFELIDSSITKSFEICEKKV